MRAAEHGIQYHNFHSKPLSPRGLGMRKVSNFIVALSMVGIVMSGPLHAANPQSAGTAQATKSTGVAAKIPDVKLNSDGLFVAQLVSTTGQPLSGRQLKISDRSNSLTTATTSPQGRVAVPGLNGGVFKVAYGNQSTILRLWTCNAAPPNAVSDLLLVQNQTVTRGQCDCGDVCSGGCDVAMNPDGPNPFSGILGQEPMMIGLLVAAAVAIPIAVHNSQADSDDAS